MLELQMSTFLSSANFQLIFQLYCEIGFSVFKSAFSVSKQLVYTTMCFNTTFPIFITTNPSQALEDNLSVVLVGLPGVMQTVFRDEGGVCSYLSGIWCDI